MGSRVRIRLFHILHFVMDFLFPLLKNSKSGVDDRGHRFRSGSPLTNYPHAPAFVIALVPGHLFGGKPVESSKVVVTLSLSQNG